MFADGALQDGQSRWMRFCLPGSAEVVISLAICLCCEPALWGGGAYTGAGLASSLRPVELTYRFLGPKSRRLPERP